MTTFARRQKFWQEKWRRFFRLTAGTFAKPKNAAHAENFGKTKKAAIAATNINALGAPLGIKQNQEEK